MEYLTRKQLTDICKKNDYIILREYFKFDTYLCKSVIHALNCKVAFFNRYKNVRNEELPTKYVSWRKCTFNEYISYKTPFMNS